MSDIDLSLLLAFGKLRRILNLRATQILKPMGIGPKQAVLLRELHHRKSACLSELARVTQTDPAATGKAIETLVRKHWVVRTDHPEDRRRWQVSLSPEGLKAAQKLQTLYRALADDFCEPMGKREKDELLKRLTQLSSHLENRLDSVQE